MSRENIINKVKGAGLVPMPVYGHTYDATTKVLGEGIPGALVECGVFAGAQVAVMAQAAIDHGETERQVHLFDSFEGIPEAGPQDDEQPGIGPIDKSLRHGRMVSSGVAVCSLQSVQRNMETFGIPGEMLVWHKGWFQDTVPEWRDDPIALLRLDGDLYESTLVCLEHLYPSLSPGGVLIVDDYTLGGCFKAVLDYFGKDMPCFTEVPLGDGCHWAVKP